MEFKEATDLSLEISSKCSLKKPKEGLSVDIDVPSSTLYDASAEGHKLRIDMSIIDESSRNCIKSIVEKRKLKMMELKGYLVIYTPRKA
jgi:hypothetical protein